MKTSVTRIVFVLATLFGLIGPHSAVATGYKVMGGGEVPFPYGSEIPMPWVDIQGTWTIEENVAGAMVTKMFNIDVVVEAKSGARVVKIREISSSGSVVAEGLTVVATKSQKILRAFLAPVSNSCNQLQPQVVDQQATDPSAYRWIFLRAFNNSSLSSGKTTGETFYMTQLPFDDWDWRSGTHYEMTKIGQGKASP